MSRINEIMGMNNKDIAILKRMMSTKAVERDFETVAEYIENHGVKTERRTSKKGIELIKVFYPTGKVAEYEASRINSTVAFEK